MIQIWDFKIPLPQKGKDFIKETFKIPKTHRCGFIKLLWKITNWSFCLIFISHVIWFQVAWIQAIWNALVTCWFEIFLQVSSEMKNVLIIFDLKETTAASNVMLFLISCSDIGSLNQVDFFRTICLLYCANHQHFKSLSRPSLSKP